MRASKLFLTWILLASTAASLSTPERWRFDLEARDGLINKRQDPQTTDLAVTDSAATDSAVPTDPAATSAPAATDVQPTTSEAAATPTSDPAAATSSPVDTTSQPPSPSPTSGPAQTGSGSSSVGLLFTQTSASSRAVVTVTAVPTNENNDSSVAFIDSKYHQLIIALGSVSAALLIALIVTAVIAFRARADNDLLHDQLSRYEEGISLQQRGKGSSLGSVGGYGRLSLSDPDDARHSRRSLSEGQLKPMAGRRLSGAPMGSGTPPGNRRVTFGGSESAHSNDPSGSSDHSPLLFPVAGGKGDPSSLPESQNLMKQTGSSDIRRLPTTPKASSSSHESYTDPFSNGPPN